MSIELVMIASNELRYVRTQLALLKKVDPGIKIDSVTVINQNGFLEEEHQYLKSRKDINRVLDYRSPGEFVWHGVGLTKFLQNNSCTDYVLFMHPDCFPIKDGWGKLLYKIVGESGISGYIEHRFNEIVMKSAVFMVDTKFVKDNNISLDIRMKRKDEPIIKYKDYDIGICHPDRIDRLYDIGTLACSESIYLGNDPFIDSDTIFKSYFEHCEHGTLLLNCNVHPEYMPHLPKFSDDMIREYIKSLCNVYYSDKYKYLKIKNVLKEDNCPTSLKTDTFTRVFNLEGF